MSPEDTNDVPASKRARTSERTRRKDTKPGQSEAGARNLGVSSSTKRGGSKGVGTTITRQKSREHIRDPTDEGPVGLASGESMETACEEDINEAKESCAPVVSSYDAQDEKESQIAGQGNGGVDDDYILRSVSPISSISEPTKNPDSDDGGASPMAGPGPRTFLIKRKMNGIEAKDMADGSCPPTSNEQKAIVVKEEDTPETPLTTPCSTGFDDNLHMEDNLVDSKPGQMVETGSHEPVKDSSNLEKKMARRVGRSMPQAKQLQDRQIAHPHVKYRERGDGYMIQRVQPDGFEVFLLIPGFNMEELTIRCYNDGRLVVEGEPRDKDLAHLWGIKPFQTEIALPGEVSAASARALLTLHGQLYIRVSCV